MAQRSSREGQGPAPTDGGWARNVRQAACFSGRFKSYTACDHELVSKSGGNSLLAGILAGGQGVHREVESEGFEENHRVVVEGATP